MPISLPAARVGCAVFAMSITLVLLADSDSAQAQLKRGDWELAGEANAVRVLQRPWPGSEFPEAMARTVFATTPRRVYQVVSGYDRFADFIPYVLESRVLATRGALRWVYQRLRFPGPITDRHYVIRVEDTRGQNGPGSIQIHWRLAVDQAAAGRGAGVLRPAAMRGAWLLQPLDGGTRTDARYIIHLDPGGALPSWFMSLASGLYLRRVMAAVRGRVQPPVTTLTSPAPEATQ